MEFRRFLPGSVRSGLLSCCAAALSVLVASTLLSACLASPAGATSAKIGLSKIGLSTHPVLWNPKNRNDIDAGDLEWAGTIEITSDNKHFGGWSGLAISADGSTLLAMSDEAWWLTAQILYDERGRLSGIGDGSMAPMLGLDGKPITTKGMGDAEGLAIDSTDPLHSTAYVSFERYHRIWSYDFAKDGFKARPTQIVTQRELGKLPLNEGLEALTLATPPGDPSDTMTADPKDPSEELIAISENARDPRGNVRGFIVDGRKVRRFSMRLHDPNRPTDLARLPNGDYLLLERRFSLLAGAGMQLRLISKDDVKPNATVDGKLLLDADQRHVIDNMEGLSVRRDQKGDTWIYVISDDNFSALQHTYLMMFRLKPAPAVTPPHTPKPAG